MTESEDFTIADIPRLARVLDRLKEEKAKTVKPKFEKWQKVHRYGYAQYSGVITHIDISIEDSGEPTITYTVENVGDAWESELELTTRPYNGPDY